ncbi:peptidase [Enterococcus sp. DIV0869a]|uniref:Peptidase n=1 Tax=Candidatus Enterococcus ikei TaxID=2815326 RepID=A0ABS3H136_9ENTE|nr:peptidase [Enterococcus sp. DIV0869a]
MLNSDGYKVLITLFNIDELDNKRKNHMIVKTIQGISILLAVWTVISWFL